MARADRYHRRLQSGGGKASVSPAVNEITITMRIGASVTSKTSTVIVHKIAHSILCPAPTEMLTGSSPAAAGKRSAVSRENYQGGAQQQNRACGPQGPVEQGPYLVSNENPEHGDSSCSEQKGYHESARSIGEDEKRPCQDSWYAQRQDDL